jgi:hypothetical protein
MATKGKWIKKISCNTVEFTPQWPNISEEAKFNGKGTGRYEVKHTVDNDSEFLKTYKAQWKVADAEAKKLFGEKYDGKFTPFKPHRAKSEKSGEWEDVPGKTDVVFKASAVDKDGEKKNLNVVDKYGRKITKPVWGGSQIEISYFPNAYSTALASGVKFQMMAVKVNTLVTKGSNPNEGMSGFTFETPPPNEESSDGASESESDEGSEEGEEDFDF